MTKVRTTQEKTVENTVITKTLELSYEYGTLIVSEVLLEQDNKETITPVMIQPWKCLPDGQREQFKDSTDAFEWFESLKHNLI
jgi:hypothetical protein